MTSGKLCPVSTCMTGNGILHGQNAFSAMRRRTRESLPPENSSTGRSNSAATSRKTWMDSASSDLSWESSYGIGVGYSCLKGRLTLGRLLRHPCWRARDAGDDGAHDDASFPVHPLRLLRRRANPLLETHGPSEMSHQL